MALADGESVDLSRVLRETAITALLAFALFLPLIGFETVQNIRNELTLETRFPLLIAFVAIVAGAKLLYALVVAPWVARRRAALASRRPLALPRSFTRWFTPFAIGF